MLSKYIWGTLYVIPYEKFRKIISILKALRSPVVKKTLETFSVINTSLCSLETLGNSNMRALHLGWEVFQVENWFLPITCLMGCEKSIEIDAEASHPLAGPAADFSAPH